MSISDILTDHAFCEQKAASNFISIIQRYSHLPEIINTLSPIITEEWGHFRMVWAEIKKRGYVMGPQRKNNYVNLLLQREPKGGYHSEDKLLHKLLICAMIEARSCERFRVLAENLEDEYLRAFYYKFMVSEAGHYRVFIDLAEKYYPVEKVRITWQQWIQVDEDILSKLPPRGDRLH
jgi:tRNA-(ms[2]io[6]A)-hydroxylase